MSATWRSRSTCSAPSPVRSPRPESVRACTSCPRSRSRDATSSQAQPPSHAPGTNTYLAISPSPPSPGRVARTLRRCAPSGGLPAGQRSGPPRQRPPTTGTGARSTAPPVLLQLDSGRPVGGGPARHRDGTHRVRRGGGRGGAPGLRGGRGGPVAVDVPRRGAGPTWSRARLRRRPHGAHRGGPAPAAGLLRRTGRRRPPRPLRRPAPGEPGDAWVPARSVQVGVGEEAVEDGLVAVDLDLAVAAAPEQEEQVGGGGPGGGVALGVAAGDAELVAGRGDEPFAFGVGGVEVDRAVERGGVLGPVGRPELEELVDAVHGEGGVDRADLAAGQLGVDAVHDGLLRHAPPHPSGVVLWRPGPDGGRRVGGLQDAGQPLEAVAVPGDQLVVWRALQLARYLGAVGDALLDDAAPEVVDLADVPDEVGGGPARAGGDRRLEAGTLRRVGEQGSFTAERRDVLLWFHW